MTLQHLFDWLIAAAIVALFLLATADMDQLPVH
jgi:hypothetical protein